MTKAQALQTFRVNWAEAVRLNPSFKGDKIMQSQAWNDYTDGLCKDRCITQEQYATWTNPF